MIDLIGRDLYILVMPQKGPERVEVHRVWDAELFFESFHDAQMKEKEPPRLVQPCSRERYLEHIKDSRR